MAKHLREVWQTPDGKWHHHKDARGEFSDEMGARTDLQFALDWERCSLND